MRSDGNRVYSHSGSCHVVTEPGLSQFWPGHLQMWPQTQPGQGLRQQRHTAVVWQDSRPRPLYTPGTLILDIQSFNKFLRFLINEPTVSSAQNLSVRLAVYLWQGWNIPRVCNVPDITWDNQRVPPNKSPFGVGNVSVPHIWQYRTLSPWRPRGAPKVALLVWRAGEDRDLNPGQQTTGPLHS